MGVPGVTPAAGEILQPHPGLVIDADVQLVLRGRIELLIVIGEPLGAVSVNDGVARPGNHVRAAWSKERQSVLPVGVIGRPGGGALLPDVSLHRPDPGELSAVESEKTGFSLREPLGKAVGGVQEIGGPVLLEGNGMGLASLALHQKDRADSPVGLLHHADGQYIVGGPVGERDSGQGAPVSRERSQDLADWRRGEIQGGEPLVQNGLYQPGTRGIMLPCLDAVPFQRRSLLALAGHQPAAGQDEEQGQDHQPDWRSPLGALEQVADARLRLPGGAGERGGERGARGGSVHGGISFF